MGHLRCGCHEEEHTPDRPGWCPKSVNTRASWDEYFMGLAWKASERATCDRLHVGCILTRDNVPIMTGYNGALRRAPHCDVVGHDIVNEHCVRVNHAEANAVSLAARRGVATEGATAYVTHWPCWPCFRLLVSAGVVRVVYGTPYKADARVLSAAEHTGVTLEFLA